MNVMVFHGNQCVQQLSAHDRGLAYGDGLFETILVDHGDFVWWPQHWQRLSAGASRLGIAMPDEATIVTAARKLIDQQTCVIKIIVTRGDSARGYKPEASLPTTVISVYPAPENHSAPIDIRWCRTQMAQQPALAGLKHLNRLENVLARGEWSTPDYADGLMCDGNDAVICATSANLFIYRADKWRTPDLSKCGVNGVARQWFLSHIPDIGIESLSRADVESAQAVFLCNAVRGMMEVNRIGGIVLPECHALKALKQQFIASNPAFAGV